MDLPSPETTAERPAPSDSRRAPAGGGLAAFVRNVAAGVLFLAFRRRAAGLLTATVPQLVLLLIADMLVTAGFEYGRVDGGHFNRAGLLPLLAGVPWLLLAAWTAARAGGNERRTLPAAVALAALWFAVGAAWGALALLPEVAWRAMGKAAPVMWWAPLGLGLLASIVALVRTVGLPPPRRSGAVLAAALLAAPTLLLDQPVPLWIVPRDESAEAAERARWQQTTSESVLYAQPRLLQEALDRMEPGRRGVPEFFLLAVGGYGGQDVFMREVQAVDRLFAERFGTAGRSLLLVNNPATVAERPIASVTALERGLAGIAARMNRDEDVLVLFMTSHGTPNYRFDLSLWPYRFDELTPDRLRQMIEQAGIRYRVVVVSACYSGGFVAPLADHDSLVISAARPDRNSHGCTHEADWTFFGRAFFDEALRATRSFELAFEKARILVAEREAAEHYEASEPQIAIGNGIRVALRGVEQRLERRD